MRREERVTVQGPVKEQQPDGMSHRGLEPGGSDDGMTITICSFFALQVCVFPELDESAAALAV